MKLFCILLSPDATQERIDETWNSLNALPYVFVNTAILLPGAYAINVAVDSDNYVEFIEYLIANDLMYMRFNTIADVTSIYSFVSMCTRRNHQSMSWLAYTDNSCYLVFKGARLVALMGLGRSVVYNSDILLYPIVDAEFRFEHLTEFLLHQACSVINNQSHVFLTPDNLWDPSMEKLLQRFETLPKGILINVRDCSDPQCSQCTCPLCILCAANVKLLIY